MATTARNDKPVLHIIICISIHMMLYIHMVAITTVVNQAYDDIIYNADGSYNGNDNDDDNADDTDTDYGGGGDDDDDDDDNDDHDDDYDDDDDDDDDDDGSERD